jgi:hypothetical protein
MVEPAGFRYHLTVLPANFDDGEEPERGPRSEGVIDGDDGWVLVRSRVTQDEVSRLMSYRKHAC